MTTTADLDLAAQCVDLRLQGLNHAEIASRVGKTRARISQILSPKPAIREAVLDRADGRCERCGEHLNTYARQVLDYHPADDEQVEYGRAYSDPKRVIVLCAPCHRKAHDLSREHAEPVDVLIGNTTGLRKRLDRMKPRESAILITGTALNAAAARDVVAALSGAGIEAVRRRD